MAKVSFTKLGLTKPQGFVELCLNEQIIEVKSYLPVNEKLELISNVINLSADDNNFANPVKVMVYSTLEIIEAYTNISFTDKQKENPTKLYDLLEGNGVTKMIFNAIPEDELIMLEDAIKESIEAVYTYKNSVMGILESMSSDYSNLNLDVDDLYTKMADKENLNVLRDVLTKLG